MLPQIISQQPLHLHIPKYLPEYSSHSLTRPKLSSPPYFGDIPQIAATRDSPITLGADTLPSPLSASINYHYDNRAFDSPISPTDMYESSSPPGSYSSTFQPAPHHPQYDSLHPDHDSRETRTYLSGSPSPVDPHRSTSALQAKDTGLPQEVPSATTYSRGHFQVNHNSTDRSGRNSGLDKGHAHSSLLDHRRMSEPAILGPTNPYAPHSIEAGSTHRLQPFNVENSPTISPPRILASAYTPSLQRGASIGSLRDLRQTQFTYPPPSPPRYPWKEGDSVRPPQFEPYRGDDGFDDQISPLQPNFGCEVDSPTTASRYLHSNDNYYGASPPGTGTSTSSAPVMSPTTPNSFIPPGVNVGVRDSRGKTYSFVPLPGNNMKKRPRRRYDEIERLYQCSWPECTKSYGTLNHLNAHVTMQRHGVKRHPNEFKELRKQWRKAKKEAEMSTSEGAGQDNLDGSRRYDSRHSSGSSIYAARSAHTVPSSIPILHTGSAARYMLSEDAESNVLGELDHHRSMHATPPRQRFSTTPSSWHGSSRSNIHGHLSSSLPSQSIAHESIPNLPHPDSALSSYPSMPYQFSRPESPPIGTRLPSDSTLLTPLPGYQPPNLSPPHYHLDGYDAYEKGFDGRPGSGYSTDRGSGDER